MLLFVLRCIELSALLAVLVTFAYRGLSRYYPAFMVYLGAEGMRSLCLLSLGPEDPIYAKCWALTAPFLMVLQLLVLLELVGKVIEHYPKIDNRAARMIITSCLGFGAIFGGISYILTCKKGPLPWYVPAAIGADKIFDWVTAGTLIFLSVWLYLYPEPLRRNIRWHRWLLAAYLGVAPGIALIFTTMADRLALINFVDCCLEITEIVCCVLWMCAMTPMGEAFPLLPKVISDEELKLLDGDYKASLSALREAFPIPELPGQN